MSKRLRRFSGNVFLQRVATTLSGTVVAQLVIFAFTPFLTRIYGPAIFGIYGVFASFVAIFTPAASLTLPIAIVLPKDEDQVNQIARASLVVSLFTSSIMAIGLHLYGHDLLSALNAVELQPYIFLISVTILLDGLFQVLQQKLIREHAFAIRAKAAIANAVVVGFLKVGCGIVLPKALTLLFLSVAGRLLYILNLIFYGKESLRVLSWLTAILSSPLAAIRETRSVLARYRDFPLFRAPQVLLHGFSDAIPVFMFSMYFGPETTGFYILGRKIIHLPVMLVGNAIGDVFYPHIANAAHEGARISRILFKTSVTMFLVGLPPSIIFMFLAPRLFKTVFGPEWIVAGQYAQWMILYLLLFFAARPTIRALPVIGQQSLLLYFTILTSIIRFLSIFLGAVIFNDSLIAIALFSLTGVVLYLALIIVTIVMTVRMESA